MRKGALLDDASRLEAILAADPFRWPLLDLVARLQLPDGWIAAGYVRNAVWYALHGRAPSPIQGDVDVIWFNPSASTAEDRRIEAELRGMAPHVVWSVKNQARMHARNGDTPYISAIDAMRFWPETATAIAVRREASIFNLGAPFGLADLFGLIIRPGPRFVGEKRSIVEQRLVSKKWLQHWPRLRTAMPSAGRPS